MSTTAQILAEIKQLMLNDGVSQKELAKRVGWSMSEVSLFFEHDDCPLTSFILVTQALEYNADLVFKQNVD